MRFLSDTLQQNTSKVSGWLRRTTRSSKLIKSAQFPMRFVILNQKIAKIQISDYPGQPPKQEYDLLNDVHSIELYKEDCCEEIKDLPTDFPSPFSIRFHSGDFMLFWAKSTPERKIWVTSLQKYVSEKPNPADVNASHYCVTLAS